VYNRYLPQDRDAFDGLYTRVGSSPEKQEISQPHRKENAHFNVSQFLEKLKFNEIGLFPLMVLALLLIEADEEERMIMLVLAAVIGI